MMTAASPAPVVITTDNCADHGHPSGAYNPWQDRTWCKCGNIIRQGDTRTCPVCGGLADARHWDNHTWCRQQPTHTRTIF